MTLFLHIAMFVLAAGAIVLMGTFYAEPDDARALRALPRRFASFLIGSAAVVGLMIVCEAIFASI